PRPWPRTASLRPGRSSPFRHARPPRCFGSCPLCIASRPSSRQPLVTEGRIDHVQQRLPREVPPEILTEERNDPIHVPGEIPRDMGRDDHPGGSPERAVRRERLRGEDIEPGPAQPPALKRREQRRL